MDGAGVQEDPYGGGQDQDGESERRWREPPRCDWFHILEESREAWFVSVVCLLFV